MSTTTIKHEGKVFELDVPKAIRDGYLKVIAPVIKDVVIGDVFDCLKSGYSRVMILSQYDDELSQRETYYISGVFGDALRPFSNGPWTKKEALKMLNENQYVYVGNIREDVTKLFTDLVKR